MTARAAGKRRPGFGLRGCAYLGSMHLVGSCSCGAVRFSLESRTPYPFMRCYCSICRKTAGSGGYAINLAGQAGTLEVHGKEHVKVYRAMLTEGAERVQSEHQRHFCGRCGSHLWAFHPAWPDLVHPLASAIDTTLPRPPEHVHMMLDSKPSWIAVEGTPDDQSFEEYPDFTIQHWHERHGLYEGQTELHKKSVRPPPRRSTARAHTPAHKHHH